MRSRQFWPGDRVVILENDEGAKPEEVGAVISRWIETVYVVKTQDGQYHWVSDPDIDSINPNRHYIEAGDVIRIKSNEHKHSFINVGDLVKVVKVLKDVDFYRVFSNGEYYWLSNLELAPYIPPRTT